MLESLQRRFKQISKTYVLWGNKNKTRHFFLIILLIKHSLQQQIHLNSYIIGIKCCRCNEGIAYYDKKQFCFYRFYGCVNTDESLTN